MTAIEVLESEGTDRLGESPWWDVETGVLWWVDILGRRIRRATLDGTDLGTTETASEVGFVIPTASGAAVAGMAGGLVRVAGGDSEALWTGTVDIAVRLNEGKTDRAGRLWFGSMHRAETHPEGRLYRWDGTDVLEAEDRVTVANGLGWTPDGRRMFFTDSPARTIWTYDYDPLTGSATGRRPFVVDEESGFPDGLTIDADGCIWSARWNGGRLVRYRPDGTVDRTIALPVHKPTSVAFAGPELRTLVVTSASAEPGDGELAGRVLLLDPGVQGIAEIPLDDAAAPADS